MSARLLPVPQLLLGAATAASLWLSYKCIAARTQKNHTLARLHQALLLLVAFYMALCVASVQGWLLPTARFARAVERWAATDTVSISASPMLDVDRAMWNTYCLPAAVSTLTVSAVCYYLYVRLGAVAYSWMEVRGNMNREKPDERGARRVTFALEERREERPRCRKRKLAVAVLLLLAMLFSRLHYTFAYTVVDVQWLTVTADRLVMGTLVVFLAKVALSCVHSLNHFPAGFSRTRFVCSQFTMLYGSLLAVATLVLWLQAHDTMMLYIYKLYALHAMRQDNQNMPHRVMVSGANYISQALSNYMLRCTYAVVTDQMSPQEVFSVFDVAIDSFNGTYADTLLVSMFVGMVFVPMVFLFVVGI